MRKLARFAITGAAAAALVAGLAVAADQTILGKSFSVKAKPGDATKTKVTGSASEKDSPNTLVGDPTDGSAGGAILTIFVDGGSSATQSFVLAQGSDSKGKPFWSGDPVKGFKYKDSKGDQSAVKSAQITLKNGKFSFKASLSGKNGPISILPPNPGTRACLAFQIGTSGDRYSVQFGPDSKITNKGDTLFKATKPLNEGVCPGGSPTTTTTVPPTTTTTAPPTTTTTAPPTTTTTAPPTTTTTAPPTTTTTTEPPTTPTPAPPPTTTTAPPTTPTTAPPTTTTTTTSTTSTTMGSPSSAFLEAAADGSR